MLGFARRQLSLRGVFEIAENSLLEPSMNQWLIIYGAGHACEVRFTAKIVCKNQRGPSSKVRAYVRLATKLPLTGNTIAIAIHFGVRAITQKIYSFFVRAHLRAMLPAITAKG